MQSATKRKLYKRPVVKEAQPVAPPAQNYATDQARRDASLDRALSKMQSLAQSLATLKKEPSQYLMDFDVDASESINLTEFRYFVKALGLRLEQNEVSELFDYIDSNRDKSITRQEFINALNNEKQKVESKPQPTQPSVPKTTAPTVPEPTSAPRQPTRNVERKPTMKENYAKLGVSEVDVEKDLQEILKNYKIEPSDYYEPRPQDKKCTTMFNDPIKCLKACMDIIANLKKTGKKYEDPDFGPNIRDPHGYKSIAFENGYTGAPNPEDVFWFRPSEIHQSSPVKFFNEQAFSNDVAQGSIGNCWLIGAMSVIATRDEFLVGTKPNPASIDVSDSEALGMMSGIYPPMFHSFRKHGLYVMRFFKNFSWRYIIFDDRFPCNNMNGSPDLIYASSSKPFVFWVPLVEKAYAKLHGAYQALISGDLSDALTDFTGLVSEKLSVQDQGRFNAKILKDPETFWNKLVNYKKSGALMGCSIIGTGIETEVIYRGEETGLLAGHAYSIQSVLSIKDDEGKQQRLMRIRNPWGYKNPKEWTGRWSDNSEEMIKNWESINAVIKATDGIEAELIDINKKDDGTFFMIYEDFYTLWSRLSVCVKFPIEYQGLRFRGVWQGASAGGTPYRSTPDQMANWANNFQYFINVTKKTHVFISLGQNDGRLQATDREVFPFVSSTHPVVIVVLKTTGEQKTKFAAPLSMSPIKRFKEVSLDVTLEPGNYVIVPSTQDIGQEGEYFLSIYHNAGEGAKLLCLDNKKPPEIIPEEEEAPQQVDNVLKRILKLKTFDTVFDE